MRKLRECTNQTPLYIYYVYATDGEIDYERLWFRIVDRDISVHVRNIREVKISPRQRQRVRERNFCVLTSSFFVFNIPGFLFVIVVVDDEMEAMSRSSLCVQKRNENDSDISLSFSY